MLQQAAAAARIGAYHSLHSSLGQQQEEEATGVQQMELG
jgi:hypothetical protein